VQHYELPEESLYIHIISYTVNFVEFIHTLNLMSTHMSVFLSVYFHIFFASWWWRIWIGDI